MDTKIVNCLRNLGIDMINDRMEGDAGLTLSLAPTIFAVFKNHLNFNPNDTGWINRDRFIMSTPGASALLYSTLFYSGYPIPIESIKKYGRMSSKLPVFSEINSKWGIECTSGNKAEGLGVSVGLAYAEKYLEKILGKDLINYYTYVMITDEDLMNGNAFEVLSFASREKLNNLIILYNTFETTSDGKKSLFLNEGILKMYEGLDYYVETVTSGEDYVSIDKAILRAKASLKPSIIEIKSVIAIGSSVQSSYNGHDTVLTDRDLELVKEKMNLTKVPYHISASAFNEFKNALETRCNPVYNEWVTKYNSVIERDENNKNLLSIIEERNLKINLKNIKANFDSTMREDFRDTNSNFMNAISSATPLFIGGSLLDSKSNKIKLSNLDRIINFGNIPSGGALIANGLSLAGLKPFISTSLNNVNNMLDGIKLSSVMNESVTYIFTNDSVLSQSKNKFVDPIEEIGQLRMIPNLIVFKPADVNELIGSWDYIINKKGPAVLIISREVKGLLPNSNKELTLKGAYQIKKENGRLSGVLVSSGNELESVLRVSEELESRGLFTRVISIPSYNLFSSLPKEEKEMLFPVGAKVIVVEPSNDPSWKNLVYSDKYLITIKGYITSGTKLEVNDEVMFNVENLTENIERLLK